MKLSRRSGILAHPTSFPSRYGIGDLGRNAFKFVDFLVSGGQTLWQVLPVNPTGFGDSPYQSFSTFAGNTLLISPDSLLEEGLLTYADVSSVPSFDPRKVDYGDVIQYKNGLYKRSYQTFKKRAKKEVTERFKDFCVSNAWWLDDFCLFTALKAYFIKRRQYSFETAEYKAYAAKNAKFMKPSLISDCFYGASWDSWDDALLTRDPDTLAIWTEKLEDDITFNKYLQFIFFEQWGKLRAYANNNGVKIIGDIPLFVAFDSADCWSNPGLFQLDSKGHPIAVAGVPPDYFSETGQLWGNPLYKWDAHAAQKFDWWIRRVEACLSLADMVRIDHFRGLEAYWSIPFGSPNAIKGAWIKGPEYALFDALERALGVKFGKVCNVPEEGKVFEAGGGLPIIAEDLGLITPEVTALRQRYGFPGMKVLQFGFSATPDNEHMPHNFTDSNVVVYSGTHDNDTTLGWYMAQPDAVKDQFRRYMNVSGDSAAWDMIRLTFMSVGVYSVVPVQDVLSLDKYSRMNTPGIPSGWWQFRFEEKDLTPGMAVGLKYLAELTDRNVPYHAPMVEKVENDETEVVK